MAQKIPFTMTRLAEIPAPATGRVYVYDSKTPGLALCVTERGTRTFYVYRKVHGRPVRIKIGRFPEITVDAARKRAQELAGEIAKGIDPQAERRRLRTSTTLGELWNHYFEHHAKVYKRAWDVDERNYKNHLEQWKSRRLKDIRRADVQALHARIGEEHGHYAANRVVALLSKMFNEAKTIGFEGDNPARGIKKFREESRERFLLPDEMARFIKALDEEPSETMQDLFWLMLLTGARKGNVLAMQWAHLNLKDTIWTIPATRAKAGFAITVHLPEKAVEILKRRLTTQQAKEAEAVRKRKRKPTDPPCPWVFPACRGDSGHLTEPKAAWAVLLERADISDLRMHDLRRTMGSWQAAAGASLSVIGKSLGHRNVSTTAIYARLNIDPVRQSVNAATAAMLKAAGDEEQEKSPDQEAKTA